MAKSIKLKNNTYWDSSGIVHEKKILKNIINNLRNYIYCGISNEIVTRNNYDTVTNWKEYNNIGNAFSISNGQILIGNDVNKVKISVKIRAYNTGNNLLYSFITKNSQGVSSTWVVDNINGYKTVYNQSIVDVSAGDKLSVNLYGDGINIQGDSTTIIVEKLK